MRQLRMNIRNAYLYESVEVIRAEADRRFAAGKPIEAFFLMELLVELLEERLC